MIAAIFKIPKHQIIIIRLTMQSESQEQPRQKMARQKQSELSLQHKPYKKEKKVEQSEGSNEHEENINNYKKLRETFLVFSMLQDKFTLKEDTIYVAFELFKKIVGRPDFAHIHPNKLRGVSIFLAMKYEEIYPPSFEVLARTLELEMELDHYKKIEQTVILAVEGNLNFPLLSRELRLQLGLTSDKVTKLGMYLLEISIVTRKIYLNFQRQKIIQAIAVLAKAKDTSPLNPELTYLCQLLLKAFHSAQKSIPFLYAKYNRSSNHYVSSATLVPD